eukprot:jgi/Undpi1/7164/HiC_scaffold_22.g09638.m1
MTQQEVLLAEKVCGTINPLDYENSMINIQQKAANIEACVKPKARREGGQSKRYTDLHHGDLWTADPAYGAPTGKAALSSSRVDRTHTTHENMEGDNKVSGSRD